MKRAIISLILLLVINVDLHAQEEKELKNLFNKEWRFSTSSIPQKVTLVYDKIIEQSDKKQAKEIKESKDDFMQMLTMIVSEAKFTFNADDHTLTSNINNEIVTEKWTYDAATKTITSVNSSTNETHTKRIESLKATEFIFVNEEGEKVVLVPVTKKIEGSSFKEISDIAFFYGNPESEVVVVNTQGGPMPELLDFDFKMMINELDAGNVLYVNVHQVQTKNPELFEKSDVTFEQAKNYDKVTIENLHKVITYFKEKLNKKVVVLGISYGAFVTQELIATYGVDIADKYLIMVGRLDIDTEFWNAFSEGKMGMFKYNTKGKAKMKFRKQGEVIERNMSRLAAGLGYNRYTERLENIKDLSKVTYVYGDRDEQVGGLSAEEISFLQAKKCNLKLVKNGTHDGAITEGAKYLKGIVQF